MVESDFSDHFVVRRQPDTNLCTHAEDLFGKSSAGSTASASSKIGDDVVTNTSSKSLDNSVSLKSLLMPSQFGKRPTVSSLLDVSFHTSSLSLLTA